MSEALAERIIFWGFVKGFGGFWENFFSGEGFLGGLMGVFGGQQGEFRGATGQGRPCPYVRGGNMRMRGRWRLAAATGRSPALG